MVTATRDTDRQAWLDWRRQGLGGSDAAVVVGLDPYRSLMELWLNKIGQLPDAEETEPMRWGTLLEGPIAAEFMHRTGLFVGGAQRLATHPDHRWMRATLDGLVYESGGDVMDQWLGIYEAKTTAAMRFGMHWGEEPPDWVICQVQHNMAVAEAEHAWVTCLVGGQRLVWYEVERDDALIRDLIDAERYFWDEHVRARVPPPVTGTVRELDAIKAAFSHASPDLPGIDLDDAGIDLLQGYMQHKQREKEAAIAARMAQEQLCVRLGEAQAGRVNGKDVITWRAADRQSVDLQKLRIDYSGLVAKYTKTTSVRTFRVARDWEEVLRGK